MEYLDKEIAKAVDVLKAGGIIAFPTDTVWGFISCAFDKQGVIKIADVKERKEKSYFITHCYDIKFIKENFILNENSSKLIKKFPAAMTLLLRGKKTFIKRLSGLIANDKIVSVRIPNNDLFLKLLKAIDQPIVSTSANISGEDICKNYDEVVEKFGNKIDYIFPAELQNNMSKPSTIIDATGESLKILRQGDFKL